MCTCKQKSKTPAGPLGNFNYVFDCKKSDGTSVEIKLTASGDERAKTLAEQECAESVVPGFGTAEATSSSIDNLEEINLICYLESDQNFYYIYPNPCKNTFYRIPKESMVKIERQSSINCNDKTLKPLFLVCFRLENTIIKVESKEASIFKHEIQETSSLSPFTLNAKIEFQMNGEGVLKYNGKEVPCLGKPNVLYPKDLTFTVNEKYPRKYSNEYQVWMYFAVLIWGQRGIYIHLGNDTLETNGNEPTKGCIHVREGNIEDFYNWINQNTRLQISYPW